MEKKFYELSYLLSPLIPPEAVEEKVSGLESLIGESGEVLGELPAVRRQLAYPVSVTVDGHNRQFLNEAYFGAFRFGLEPAALRDLIEKIKRQSIVIRFLLIHLPPVVSQTPILRSRQSETIYHPLVSPSSSSLAAEPRTKLSTEEMDKQIEELIAT